MSAISSLSPLEPPQLVRSLAFNDLRSAIIAGKIAPGTRLIERELCEALKISRPSVREVIRQLEAERLVHVEPRKGPTVAILGKREALELYEVRCIFETLLVEKFTTMADAAAISGLREIYTKIQAASKKRDLHMLVDLNIQLDEHMNKTVQHEVVMDLLKHLNARISVLRMTSLSHEGRVEKGCEEIGQVIEAVEARDPARAAQAMRQYVENARNDAMDMLERKER